MQERVRVEMEVKGGELRQVKERWQVRENECFQTSMALERETPGASGPKPQAAFHLFARPEETALGVSFNSQSQVPDIPGISSRAAISQYTASLQTQSKDPDIPLLSLYAYTEELSDSFNTQS